MAYLEMFSSGMMASIAGAGYNSYTKGHQVSTVALRLAEGVGVGAVIDAAVTSSAVDLGRGSLIYVLLVGGGVWYFFNNDFTRPLIDMVDQKVLSMNVNLGKVEMDT